MQPTDILTPVVALAAWTFVIMVWMYATRIPAMTKAKVDAQAAQHPGSLDVLPSEVRRIADNYNHLFEQPTVFYAMALVIWATGHVDALHIGLAWAFVLLRIAHSLIQCTVNRTLLRFAVFLMSWLALGIMIARELAALL